MRPGTDDAVDCAEHEVTKWWSHLVITTAGIDANTAISNRCSRVEVHVLSAIIDKQRVGTACVGDQDSCTHTRNTRGAISHLLPPWHWGTRRQVPRFLGPVRPPNRFLAVAGQFVEVGRRVPLR